MEYQYLQYVNIFAKYFWRWNNINIILIYLVKFNIVFEFICEICNIVGTQIPNEPNDVHSNLIVDALLIYEIIASICNNTIKIELRLLYYDSN